MSRAARRQGLGGLLRRSLAGIALASMAIAPAVAAEPIKIGFGMALTGGLAANGKSALLAMKIWEADTNAKGGLLGRPVQLVYYDDQSNPSTVPGLYTKLLDVDKVDLIVGGYATNMLAPAMPVVMQHNMTFIGLFGLAVNSEFHYPRYFAMVPSGPHPKTEFSKGFFDVAVRRIRSRRPSPSSPPMPSSRATPPTARARTRNRTGSRSSMTRPIRPRPSISPRSCGRSRRPTLTSSISAPIRRTRPAWCAPSTRSGSR